jgi:hypothetical protein
LQQVAVVVEVARITKLAILDYLVEPPADLQQLALVAME